jgi:hypothetical protein
MMAAPKQLLYASAVTAQLQVTLGGHLPYHSSWLAPILHDMFALMLWIQGKL